MIIFLCQVVLFNLAYVENGFCFSVILLKPNPTPFLFSHFFLLANCFWELRKYCLSNNFCKFYSKICLSKLFIFCSHVTRKSCQGLGIGINLVDIHALLCLIFLFTEMIDFLNLFNTSREKKWSKYFSVRFSCNKFSSSVY